METRKSSSLESAVAAFRAAVGNSEFQFRVALLTPLQRRILEGVMLRLDPDDVIDEIAIALHRPGNQRYISENTLRKAKLIWVNSVRDIAETLLAPGQIRTDVPNISCPF